MPAEAAADDVDHGAGRGSGGIGEARTRADAVVEAGIKRNARRGGDLVDAGAGKRGLLARGQWLQHCQPFGRVGARADEGEQIVERVEHRRDSEAIRGGSVLERGVACIGVIGAGRERGERALYAVQTVGQVGKAGVAAGRECEHLAAQAGRRIGRGRHGG